MSTLNEKLTGSPMGDGKQNAGFSGNLRMIRPAAWAVAMTIFVGMQLLFWFVVLQVEHPDLSNAPETVQRLFAMTGVRLFLSFLPGLILASLVLLIGFVYVDAKRRRMRYIMWTLLSIFIPNLIGVILYFILRDPLPMPCPKCGYLATANMSFCPLCSTELLRNCRVCHKKIDMGWSNCAYCGAPVGAQVQKQS